MALDYLHQNNLIHYDIKPENILVQKSENEIELKVADFGLVDEYDGEKDRFRGTYVYMAPEVLSGVFPVSVKSDIYSAGVVLFYVLFGSIDPLRFSFKEVVQESRKTNNRLILKGLAKLGKNKLTNILMKMLDFNPSFRISAKECLNLISNTFSLKALSNNENRNKLSERMLILRKKELSIIKSIYGKKLYNSGTFVLVNGDEGSGKGRIIDELKIFFQLKLCTVFYLKIPNRSRDQLNIVKQISSLLGIDKGEQQIKIQIDKIDHQKSFFVLNEIFERASSKKKLVILFEKLDRMNPVYLETLLKYLLTFYKSNDVFFIASLNKQKISGEQISYFTRYFRDNNSVLLNLSSLVIEDVINLVNTVFPKLSGIPDEFYMKIYCCSGNSITKVNKLLKIFKEEVIEKSSEGYLFYNLYRFDEIINKALKELLVTKSFILTENQKLLFSYLSQLYFKIEITELSFLCNIDKDSLIQTIETLPDEFKTFLVLEKSEKFFVELAFLDFKENIL